MRKPAAILIAVTAWAGLAVQVVASSAKAGSLLGGLWSMSGFFTIWTNLAVAVTFGAIAAGRDRAARPRLIAGLMLAILLVGVIYVLLLWGLEVLSGPAMIANLLLHFATPVLVPLFWLAFIDKGTLGWRDPLRWMLFPLAYLGYALVRAHFTGRYAYPFINVAEIGWISTIVNSALIALGFAAIGLAVVALDRLLATSPPRWSPRRSGSRDI